MLVKQTTIKMQIISPPLRKKLRRLLKAAEVGERPQEVKVIKRIGNHHFITIIIIIRNISNLVLTMIRRWGGGQADGPPGFLKERRRSCFKGEARQCKQGPEGASR